MVELIGDNCEPNNLVIPTQVGTVQSLTQSGAIFISGANAYVVTGTGPQQINN